MISKKRIMALDVGDARVGIAVSDSLQITALPHSTIERKQDYLEKIIALISTQNVSKVIIGLPYELSGDIGPQGEKVCSFADQLTRKLRRGEETKNVEIQLWDERLTTRQAEQVIVGSKLKNKDRRSALDRIAASLILQSYMACNT